LLSSSDLFLVSVSVFHLFCSLFLCLSFYEYYWFCFVFVFHVTFLLLFHICFVHCSFVFHFTFGIGSVLHLFCCLAHLSFDLRWLKPSFFQFILYLLLFFFFLYNYYVSYVSYVAKTYFFLLYVETIFDFHFPDSSCQ